LAICDCENAVEGHYEAKDKMAAQIRPMILDDFGALTMLMDEIHDYHVAGAPDAFKHAEAPVLPREQISEKITQPDQLYLCAMEGSRMVGFLWGQLHERTETHIHRQRRLVIVDTLGVAESHRGTGVGRALMQAAEQWGVENGAREAFLTVWDFNESAIAFYERLGYNTEQRRMSKNLVQDGE
jgi:diamine N-acetyltransferase